MWRDVVWFQQVTIHQAAVELSGSESNWLCDPFWGTSIYHTPWNRLWPLLALNAVLIWIPGLLGYVLSFAALGMIVWRYVGWGYDLAWARGAVASGQCGSEVWAGVLPAWQDIAVLGLVLGLAVWRSGTAVAKFFRRAPKHVA